MGSVVKSVTSGIFGGGDAAKDAGQAAAQSSAEAVAEQRRQFDITQENLSPFLEAGKGALTQQQALLGLSGQDAQQTAFDQFRSSPGQQFLRDRGERALLRNSSAIGGLGGGNVRSALQQEGIGFAAQDFGNQFNRLAGLTGQGQQTGVNLGQFGANTSANIGTALQAGGQARASGILGAQQANAGLAGNLIGLGSMLFKSDIRLKTNIKEIGKLPSGIGWYEWDWIEDIDQPSEGVIAQEVLPVIPDAVNTEGEYMTVDYARIH